MIAPIQQLTHAHKQFAELGRKEERKHLIVTSYLTPDTSIAK